MRNLLALIVVISVAVCTNANADAFDSVSMDTKIKQLQSSLENQIERLKFAREQAGTTMSLARIRVAEELRRSQENLEIQVEALARFREQLSEQGARSDQALEQLKNDWSQRLGSAVASIESQLGQTNDLIRQMEALRQSFDPDEGVASDISIGPLTITTPPSPPVVTAPVPAQPESVQPTTPTVSTGTTETVQPTTPTVSTTPSGGG
ncbi:MAG: hypothetical protein HY913_07105 [Desulfomonile tiedjei]|nr:hypothetical protein [Desulfomonile tiedjei]